MIWNGTDLLQPDHEVAYRGWPTERVRLMVAAMQLPCSPLTFHDKFGHQGQSGISPFDLIPLQQQETQK